MTMIRWNPVREMATMQRMMDRLMDDAWTTAAAAAPTHALALDVHESAEAYTVVAALPGINPDQIEVTLNNRTLTITADLPGATAAEGAKVLLNERLAGKFSRSITLGQMVNGDAIAAEYAWGVLTLTLPKAESAKPRQIPVRSTIVSQN
ncbi:MAG: Hsp20/alpha crystallin family protein [Anaerolineae bacterium]|nr:Hsp20/alpha crystallin family protein [Anaerolineae bacterium]